VALAVGAAVAVVAVRGLGGIGKTQLSLEYAHRALADGGLGVAWWVRADSPVSLVEDLCALAPVLGLEIDPDQPPEELAARVLTVLRGRADWLVVFDNADPGKPKIAWNDEAARSDLVDALVTDAIRLLAALPEREHGPEAADALGLLALVAGQDVEPAEGSDGRDGRWRITKGTAENRMVSTVDPEARHVHKTRSHKQDGYKAHLAIEPETGIYTAVAIRPGAGPEHHEATVALDLLDQDEQAAGLHVYGDTAYSSGDAVATLLARGHRLFLKPAPVKTAIPGGYSLDDFRIDTINALVTCPAGTASPWPHPPGSTTNAAPSSSSCAPAARCANTAPPPNEAGS
jgi:hypothetical protein